MKEGEGEGKETFFPTPSPLTRAIFRAAFAPKQHGNAYFAGYGFTAQVANNDIVTPFPPGKGRTGTRLTKRERIASFRLFRGDIRLRVSFLDPHQISQVYP